MQDGFVPVVRSGRLKDGGEARKEFKKLLAGALKVGVYSTFKISLNSDNIRPWINNVLYSLGMSDKVTTLYRIEIFRPEEVRR